MLTQAEFKRIKAQLDALQLRITATLLDIQRAKLQAGMLSAKQR